MKKILKWLVLLPVLFAAACTQKEIVFDHEQQAFEIKEGKILLEVIVPSTTKDSDEIYISGAFNGGDEAAQADKTWYLEKSVSIDRKWGIYLDPATFKDGKTLSDGYRFVSVREGEERGARNEDVVRTESPAPGTSTNLYVCHWNLYFYVAPDIEHDGPVIYIDDKTGWDAIALYAWGDAEAFGGWPGILPTGTEVKNGQTWKYFDCGESNRGLTLNLIFNNNNGGTQLKDYAITLDQDEYFLIVTADGVEADTALPAHEGYIRIYADNQAGWEAVALYQWGDQNGLGGEWPGMQPSGTAKIAGYTYTYFDYAVADVEGKTQNLIFNNNGAGIQTGDMPVTFSAETPDHFYLIYGTKDCIVIEDPFNREPAPEPEPEPEPSPEAKSVNIFVKDNTGWETLNLYAWGNGIDELFGGWPGEKASTTVTFAGVPYWRFSTNENLYGLTYNLIFNNGEAQFNGPALVLDQDWWMSITPEEAVLEDAPASRIYVSDNTGWETVSVYAWGDAEVFGGWPGAAPAGTENIGGTDYLYFEVSGEFAGKTVNLIFNNTNGVQLADYNTALYGDMFLSIDAESVKTVE
ncbi:MAG: starch-binding protein [Candidatus Cryptobacteroides sp.]